MVNELCELAASGVSTFQFILLSIAILGMSSTLFVLHKKGARARWILPLLLLVLTLTTPLPQGVFAQSAEDCPPAQTNDQTPAPDEPNAIGGLVDDNPALNQILGPGNEFEGYEGSFLVLNNDNAPDGDPFDVRTLQLISDYRITDEYGMEMHLILDPNDQTMPDPDGDWWDAPNVWGYWYLDLTCDPSDTVHCPATLLDEENNPVPGTESCINNSTGACWPTGFVGVFLSPSAAPGSYTIQYTVKTQSGVPLLPATITVNNAPSPITAVNTEETYLLAGMNCAHNPFDENWSIDLMNFVSTTGTGTLLPTTIDLDPGSPGIQSSVTEFGTTFTVDENGIVTMTAPTGPTAYPSAGFSFTIQDSDGFTSNVATGLGVILGSSCS